MESSKGEWRTNMTLRRGGRIERSSRQEEVKKERRNVCSRREG